MFGNSACATASGATLTAAGTNVAALYLNNFKTLHGSAITGTNAQLYLNGNRHNGGGSWKSCLALPKIAYTTLPVSTTTQATTTMRVSSTTAATTTPTTTISTTAAADCALALSNSAGSSQCESRLPITNGCQDQDQTLFYIGNSNIDGGDLANPNYCHKTGKGKWHAFTAPAGTVSATISVTTVGTAWTPAVYLENDQCFGYPGYKVSTCAIGSSSTSTISLRPGDTYVVKVAHHTDQGNTIYAYRLGIDLKSRATTTLATTTLATPAMTSTTTVATTTTVAPITTTVATVDTTTTSQATTPPAATQSPTITAVGATSDPTVATTTAAPTTAAPTTAAPTTATPTTAASSTTFTTTGPFVAIQCYSEDACTTPLEFGCTDPAKVIAITDAFYGRESKEHCVDANMNDITCRADIHSVWLDTCEGKNNCSSIKACAADHGDQVSSVSTGTSFST